MPPVRPERGRSPRHRRPRRRRHLLPRRPGRRRARARGQRRGVPRAARAQCATVGHELCHATELVAHRAPRQPGQRPGVLATSERALDATVASKYAPTASKTRLYKAGSTRINTANLTSFDPVWPPCGDRVATGSPPGPCRHDKKPAKSRLGPGRTRLPTRCTSRSRCRTPEGVPAGVGRGPVGGLRQSSWPTVAHGGQREEHLAAVIERPGPTSPASTAPLPARRPRAPALASLSAPGEAGGARGGLVFVLVQHRRRGGRTRRLAKPTTTTRKAAPRTTGRRLAS